MAYVDQSVIDDVRAELKALNKKYGMKATASGKGTSSLTITISSGPLDFLNQIKSYYAGRQYLNSGAYVADLKVLTGVGFNHYHDEDKYTGKEQEYLKEIKRIVYKHHWDQSDIMTDYFSCAYYIHIQFGKWNKAYKCTKGIV
jgi:hypothetical protein